MIDDFKKELIALEVIKTLKVRFDNFPEDASNNRNAPFHEAFLKAFSDKLEGKIESIPVFISLSSWMHGLNTTLGQSFFEHVAQILCDGEKRGFKNLMISQSQQTTISDIMVQLKNGVLTPNLSSENRSIFQMNEPLDKEIPNFTADVFFDDNSQIVAIELKTVKPNSGVFQGEKDKILRAKAALKNKYPDKNIKYFIGFPFDPLSDNPTSSNKEGFLDYAVDFRKYFAPEEVLLADELWDYLSGVPDTMEAILEIINTIATPDFMDYFQLINDTDNILNKQEQVLEVLEKWHLLREKKLVENYTRLFQQAGDRKGIKRTLKQSAFNSKGDYKNDRYDKLNTLLTSIPVNL